LAYVPVIILSVNAVIASVTTQLTNLLNSIGDIKLTMKFMVMWTILTWFFVPAVAYKWGVNGASVGYMVVGVSSFLVFVASKRRVDWSIYESVVRPIIASLIMGFLVFVFLRLTPQNLTSLVSGIVLGAVLYVTILYLLVGKSLPLDVKKIVESIIRKSF
jgi:O-antigen/teichoic acid export membrane protein